MCTTDRDIHEAIAQIDGLLKEVIDLAKDVGVNIDITAMTHDDPDDVSGWADVGDYERYLYIDGTCWWNYRPRVIKGDGYDVSLYKDHVDPAKIVSFTMPPKDGSNPDP